MKAISITPEAAKQMRKLGAVAAKRLRERIEAYAAGEQSDVVAFAGRPGAKRLRAGEWRAVFTENDEEMTIFLVGHRRNVYD